MAQRQKESCTSSKTLNLSFFAFTPAIMSGDKTRPFVLYFCEARQCRSNLGGAVEGSDLSRFARNDNKSEGLARTKK